jgi:hypothetical protein
LQLEVVSSLLFSTTILIRETALKGDFGKILQPIARIGMSWIAPEQIFDAEMPFPY